VDEVERTKLRELGITAYTMDEIIEDGIG